MAGDDSPGAEVISMHLVGERPSVIPLSFETFPFSNEQTASSYIISG